MKKFFIFVPFALLFLFASCSAEQTVSYTQPPFEAVASTNINGSEFSVNINYSSDGKITLTVIKPENISGLVFSNQISQTGNFEIIPNRSSALTGSKNAADDLLNSLSSLCSQTFELNNNNSLQAVSVSYTFGTFSAEINCTQQRINSIKTQNYKYVFEYQQ